MRSLLAAVAAAALFAGPSLAIASEIDEGRMDDDMNARASADHDGEDLGQAMKVYYDNTLYVSGQNAPDRQIYVNPNGTYLVIFDTGQSAVGEWDVKGNNVCFGPVHTPGNNAEALCGPIETRSIGDVWVYTAYNEKLEASLHEGRDNYPGRNRPM